MIRPLIRPLILALLAAGSAAGNWHSGEGRGTVEPVVPLSPCYPNSTGGYVCATGQTVEPSSIQELRAINKSDLQRAYEACGRHAHSIGCITTGTSAACAPSYDIYACNDVAKAWLASPEYKAEVDHDARARAAQDAADRALIERVSRSLK